MVLAARRPRREPGSFARWSLGPRCSPTRVRVGSVAAGGERTLDDDRAGIDEQARRLYLSRWLTRRAQTVVGGAIPDDTTTESLTALAVRLRGPDSNQGPLGGVRF